MIDYTIKESTEEENKIIWKGIIEYDSQDKLNKTGSISVNRVIKDSDNKVIGGILSVISYHFNTLYVELLWIHEDHRGNGYGSILLREVEKVAILEKCTLIHLESDQRAKEFYIKNEYEIFGQLEDVPEGYTRYYFKKVLK